MTDYPGTHWGESPCASYSNLPGKLKSLIILTKEERFL